MTHEPCNAESAPSPASAASANDQKTAPVLPAFDTAKYRALAAPFELSEQQERELLETLWSIMYSFVEMGFRVDVCSAVFGETEKLAEADSGPVDSIGPTFSEKSSNPDKESP